MTIKTTIEIVERESITSITCDVCNQEYTDELELQEFIIVDYIGGFNSVFGDKSNIILDICQHCFKQILGDYIKCLQS